MAGTHAVQDVRAPWVRGSVVACVLALVAVLFGPITAAVAAPGIQLSKDAPGEVLMGEPITYTLTVTNPPSNPDATDRVQPRVPRRHPTGRQLRRRFDDSHRCR